MGIYLSSNEHILLLIWTYIAPYMDMSISTMISNLVHIGQGGLGLSLAFSFCAKIALKGDFSTIVLS